jgi:hypothetical protein
MSQSLVDYVEINIYEILPREEQPPLLFLDTQEYMKWCGRVYERKTLAYRLPELARGRVTKHAMLSPGRTYIGLVAGIGEVARARKDP